MYFLQDNFHNFTGFASGVFRYSPENPDLLTTLGLLYMQVSWVIRQHSVCDIITIMVHFFGTYQMTLKIKKLVEFQILLVEGDELREQVVITEEKCECETEFEQLSCKKCLWEKVGFELLWSEERVAQSLCMWLLNNKAVEAKMKAGLRRETNVQIFQPTCFSFVVLSVFTQKKCFSSVCVYAEEVL